MEIVGNLSISGSALVDHVYEVSSGHGVSLDGVTLKDGGALAITGGTNTFNLTNGTAVLDVAAGSAVNVDANLTVESASFINQDLTTDAGPTFDHLHTASIIAPAAAFVVKPTTDGTTALQLSDKDGNAILNVDTTNDRVGIGTTGPGAALHVRRSSGESKIEVQTTDASNRAFLQVRNDQNDVWEFNAWGSTKTGTLFGINRARLAELVTNTDVIIGTSGSKFLAFGTDSLERVRITNTGNVGIGTTGPSSKLDVTTASLGTTQTTSSGLALVNTTAAAAGAQQISPAIRWSGFGWKTDATAASQAVGFQSFVVPVQGAANPTGYLTFQSSVNAAAYGDRMVITSGGDVGIGTTTPDTRLQIKQVANDVGSAAFSVLSADGASSKGIIYTNGSSMILREGGVDTLFVDGGNVGIGTTTFGTSAAKVLGIGSGTAPSSSPADMAQMWVEDVGGAGQAELRVRDELGNVTTLSPHNFTLFQPDVSYTLPWSYYSKNSFIGKEINVDMYGAIAEIEKVSGKKFIHTRDIPKDSWDGHQEIIRAAKDAEIQKANDRISSLETTLAELSAKLALLVDEKEKAEAEKEIENKRKEKTDVKVPVAFKKRNAPKYIADRMK